MKLVMITGGSRGLGWALCRHYLEAGWHVLDLSRSGGDLGKDQWAGHFEHFAVDLARLDARWDAWQQRLTELAALSWEQVVLINNAGQVTPIGMLGSLDDADILASLNANLVSGMRIIASVVRHFQAQAGRKVIVSLSSGAAHKGYAGWSLYCAAKAGLENFMRALALEQVREPHPITCFTFGPGVIDTGMQADIRQARFPELARFVALKEQNQLRQPDNVAQILFALCISQPENGRAYTVNEFD